MTSLVLFLLEKVFSKGNLIKDQTEHCLTGQTASLILNQWYHLISRNADRKVIRSAALTDIPGDTDSPFQTGNALEFKLP
jgi:hypothetical protein